LTKSTTLIIYRETGFQMKELRYREEGGFEVTDLGDKFGE
jgi:hypothetical protein